MNESGTGNNITATNPLQPPIDYEFTRRQFLQMTVAASAVAVAVRNAWAAEANKNMPYRTLGRTGEKVSAIGLGGYHIGEPKEEQKVFGSSAPRSMVESTSWIIRGITMTVAVSFAWAKPCVMATAKKSFS